MKRVNQNGFSVVETLLIIVVIGLISGAGSYVWHAKKSAESNLKVSSQNTAPVRQKSTFQGPTVQIKELGIQFQVPEALHGMGYEISDVQRENSQTVKAATLQNPDLNSLAERCAGANGYASSPAQADFAALTRIPGRFDAKHADLTDGSLVKQFDTFYIAYSVPNGNICGLQDASLSQQWLDKVRTSQRQFYPYLLHTIREIKP